MHYSVPLPVTLQFKLKVRDQHERCTGYTPPSTQESQMVSKKSVSTIGRVTLAIAKAMKKFPHHQEHPRLHGQVHVLPEVEALSGLPKNSMHCHRYTKRFSCIHIHESETYPGVSDEQSE